MEVARVVCPRLRPPRFVLLLSATSCCDSEHRVYNQNNVEQGVCRGTFLSRVLLRVELNLCSVVAACDMSRVAWGRVVASCRVAATVLPELLPRRGAAHGAAARAAQAQARAVALTSAAPSRYCPLQGTGGVPFVENNNKLTTETTTIIIIVMQDRHRTISWFRASVGPRPL